jgi:hypothetical protein
MALVEDTSGFWTDQNIVRSLLAEKLNWNGAKVC